MGTEIFRLYHQPKKKLMCHACAFSEKENAGLNVTCASRVILVESVVNHAFELQAIARIDRMGQTRPTEGVYHLNIHLRHTSNVAFF